MALIQHLRLRLGLELLHFQRPAALLHQLNPYDFLNPVLLPVLFLFLPAFRSILNPLQTAPRSLPAPLFSVGQIPAAPHPPPHIKSIFSSPSHPQRRHFSLPGNEDLICSSAL
jgi:hypothetical protein